MNNCFYFPCYQYEVESPGVYKIYCGTNIRSGVFMKSSLLFHVILYGKFNSTQNSKEWHEQG